MLLPKPDLAQGYDFDIAPAPLDVNSHRLAIALKREVDRTSAYAQVSNLHFFQRLGQSRMVEIDARFLGLYFQAQAGLQHHKYRSSRPRLR